MISAFAAKVLLTQQPEPSSWHVPAFFYCLALGSGCVGEVEMVVETLQTASQTPDRPVRSAKVVVSVI
jgi:hypothetical protein